MEKSNNEKYHITEKGVGKCDASIRKCPYGGDSGNENHYLTKEEAQNAFDEQKSKEYGTLINNKSTINCTENLPYSNEDLFEDLYKNNGYLEYRYYDNELSMDNIESMNFFIENIGDEYIIENEGTQIVISHPNYGKNIQIDSGGLGDFFSHKFECQFIDKSDEDEFM